MTFYRFVIKWRDKDTKYSKPKYFTSKYYPTYDDAEDAAFIAYIESAVCTKRNFMGFHVVSELWNNNVTLEELNESL